ncbi:MAG: hypothetical protein PUP92_23140 [Rhizonema sp. PD38]|nr:hypothetical protein [Rhizonema sp. PD38]
MGYVVTPANLFNANNPALIAGSFRGKITFVKGNVATIDADPGSTEIFTPINGK